MTAKATSGAFTMKVADGVAITANKLLTMSATNVVSHAGTTDDVIGVALNNVPTNSSDRAAGDVVAVQPLDRNGLLRFVAAAAFPVGAVLHKAAAGTVDDAVTEPIGYVAVEAATAANDIILAAPYV